MLGILELLWERKWRIVAAALLGAGIGFTAATMQTPVYQAATTIEVLPARDNVMEVKGADAAGTEALAGALDTQVRLLQSRSLLTRVVAKLKEKEPRTLEYSQSRLETWLGERGLPNPGVAPPYEEGLRMARQSVKAKILGDSTIIQILCDSPDPQLARDFANAVAEEYIETNMRARWATAIQVSGWLAKHLEEQKQKLTKSEQDLQSYAREANLLFTNENDTSTENELTLLQNELSRTRADRAARQARYELSTVKPELLPDIVNDATLRGYQSQMTELRRQLAELSTELTPAHPKVIRVQAQLDELGKAHESEKEKNIGRILSEYQESEKRERMLLAQYEEKAAEVSRQAQNGIQYGILKREVDANQQLYATMLSRVKELSITAAMQSSNIRIVDEAFRPDYPYWPNPVRSAAFGFLTAGILAVGLIGIKETADQKVKKPGDGPVQLNLPELGVIPWAGVDGEPEEGRRAFGHAESRRNDPTAGVELITWRRKSSIVAESFRSSLASMMFSHPKDRRPRVLAFTSAETAEGKSTVVSNLGAAVGEIGYRVLLVDGDVRRPRLHQVLGVANTWGLADVLQSKNPIDEFPLQALIRETPVPNVFFLPTGPPSISTTHLFFSERFAQLIRRFRREFDLVLIDTPPTIAFPDARIIAQHADGVVVVIRAGHTRREVVTSAISRLQQDGVNVLGTILNNWKPQGSSRAYPKSYRYAHP